MVMFTCKWRRDVVGGNAEREVLQRKEPCGLISKCGRRRPVYESIPQTHLEKRSAGKETAIFDEKNWLEAVA